MPPLVPEDHEPTEGAPEEGFEANQLAKRRIAVPRNVAEVRIPFRLGKGQAGLTLSLVWEDGAKTDILFRGAPATLKMKMPKDGDPERTVEQRLPDACVEIPALRTRYFVRPNPEFYDDAARRVLRARWTSLPGAADHPFLLSLRVDSTGVGLDLDGNYIGHVAGKTRLKEAIFPLPEDAAVECVPGGEWEPWLPLDIRSLVRPGAMSDAVLDIDRAAVDRRGVPLRIGGGANADVGCVRDVSPPVNIDDCIYRYLERSAFEGMPESLLMSVPVAPYTRAWVVCAAEDEPTKEPIFMVRLTRYRRGGIGNAMVTTPVQVPTEADASGAERWRIGTVTYSTRNGKRTTPLWLVEVGLDSAEIQDMLYNDWNGGRLDLELMGRERNSKSGVHVFAVTLERSPAEMEVKQVVPGSVFHNAEEPEMNVALRPLTSCTVVLGWTVEDVRGRQVAAEERKLELRQETGAQHVRVPLRMKENGWYKVVFSLLDAKGRFLLAHTAAYAQLPPDTRKAGFESPFGCWWQPHWHSGMTDPKVIGPLLFKAGIRRTTATAESEANMAPWKVTLDMIPWGTGYRPPGSPELTPEEWLAEYERSVREWLRKFPNTGMAMIFHESYGETWLAPESWWGEPRPLSAFALVEKAKLACAMLREKFPTLKIIVGNSGWSGALISQLLRGGLPPEQIDALGMERLIGYFPKDTMAPERHEASWAIRQIGLKYGCKAPPSDCYESGGRGNYGMSQRMIAEYVVRDSLVGLAWGYPYVGLGVISENINGYYHTRWGGDSILRRAPLLYPQPQYVAIATMTRVLDCAKLVRRVPTGSHTAYALEFSRGDEHVYALWTPRGTCEMSLSFPQDGPVTIDSFYGQTRRENVVAGKLTVKATEEVTYVTTLSAATGVTAGKRSFPADEPPADAAIVVPMTDPSTWTVVGAKAVECGPLPYGWLPWRTTGKCKLGPATDPERGPCLRLELIPEGEVPELLSECLALQARTPIAIPGVPCTIGVWVKGNSCWGRVIFEIMDAEGERFRGGEGVIEPHGTSYINFDGWCFVSLPLSENSPVRDHFLHLPTRLWTGNGGNGLIDYPLRLTGLIVELKRKALDLAEMVTVEPAILLKDVSVYGAAQAHGPAKPHTPPPATQSATATDEPDADTILYRDSDLRYVSTGARPPGFAEGCIVKEENGKRFISCERVSGNLFRNLGYYGAAHWLDYEWSFRFRFPVKGRIGFSCCVRTGIAASPFLKAPPMGPEDRCKWIALDYSAEDIAPRVVEGVFQMARGCKWTDKGLEPLEAERWYRTVIRAAGRALDVYLEHAGRLVQVYRGPIPAGGGGIGLTSANPIDLADIAVREVVPTPEDWSYAGRIRLEHGSPVPGAKCFRIDGPFMVTDAIQLAPGKPCILSAYIRADKDGATATMVAGNRTRTVSVTRDWKRYSFLTMPETNTRTDEPCLFGLKGSEECPIRIAAPQVEYAPLDPDAKRAANWLRTLEEDYELDEGIAHRGQRSMRSMSIGRSVAVQEGQLPADESRTLLLGAWHRADGTLKSAKLRLELYPDRRYWTPRTPEEEEPHETFYLDLKTGAAGWEYSSSRPRPKNPFRRYRLTVLVESLGGTIWLDDLVLRPIGASTTPPDAAAVPDESAKEKAGIGKEPDEDASLLGTLEDGEEEKGNLLLNPGFEELMAGGVVTSKSDRPSPYGPTDTPNAWMKTGTGAPR